MNYEAEMSGGFSEGDYHILVSFKNVGKRLRVYAIAVFSFVRTFAP